MKKSTICLFVLSLLFANAFVSGGAVFAATAISGTDLTWDLTNGVLTIDYDGSGSSKAMPSNYTTSGAPWYSSRANITSIIVKDNVTSIGQNAFYNCYNATTVQISPTVTSIGSNAFYGCSKVATVNYRKNSMSSSTQTSTKDWSQITFANEKSNPLAANTSGGDLYYVGQNGYSGGPTYGLVQATALTSLGTITSIKNYAFVGIKSMTSVTFPTSVTSIGTYAFKNCTGLTTVQFGTNANNPCNVTSIGSYAFNGCSKIATIRVYGGLSKWLGITFSSTDSNPFYSSTDANAPSRKLYIDGTADANVQTSVTLTANVPANVFYNNNTLTSVTISEGVTEIGANAFSKCSGLTSLSLPSTISSIGSNAFNNCSNLASYSYAGTMAQWLGITFSGSSSNPMNYARKCFVNGNTEITDLVIPNGTTAIKNYAFYNCSGLTSVTLPASLTSSGTAAFSTCTNIANVNFLGTIDQWCGITFAANIANPAFFSKQLSINGVEQTDIYLSDDLTEIKNYVFQANAALTRISVKNTTTIQPNALTNCNADIVVRGELSADFGTGLHWSLLDGVLTITKVSGTGAMPTFSSAGAPWYPYRMSISKIIVDEGVTQVGAYAFQGFVSQSGIYLPSTLTQIANRAFDGSSGIDYIVSEATTPPTIIDAQNGPSSYTSNTFNGVPSSAIIYVPSGSETSYSTAVTSTHGTDSGWKRFSTIVSNRFSGTCGAAGNEANVTWLYNPVDRSLTISGNGAMADFSLDGAPWNGIRVAIASINIGEGITTIGRYAFYHCDNATSLALPASLTELKTGALWYCDKLASYTYAGTLADWLNVTIGGSDANPTRYTGKFIVNNDEEITNLVIPSGTTSIGQFAFYGCTGLTSVTIPTSMASFGNMAFSGCNNIATVNYLGSIEDWCAIDFVSNQSNPAWLSKQLSINGVEQTNIYLPDELTEIKDYAFGYNMALEVVSIKNTTTIATHAFDNCTAEILYRGDASGVTDDGLSWSLVDGLLTISGNGAMADYSETETPWYRYRNVITGVVVDEGVTAIGRNAFAREAATSVLIASTVASVGDWAFSGCTSLASITCNAVTPPTVYDHQVGQSNHQTDAFTGVPTNIPVMVPSGSAAAYQSSRTSPSSTSSGWARFTNIREPSSAIDIKDNANNGVTLTACNGEERTVNLTRTINSASYNTICLPFAMTAAQVETVFGAGCDIQELTRASYEDDNLKLFFTKRTAIEAGKPYLIQPAASVANPTITGVTIDNTLRPFTSEDEQVRFIGAFSPTTIPANDDYLILGAENTLYMSNGAGQLKGLRAYFRLGAAASVAARRGGARIVVGEAVATTVESAANPAAVTKCIEDGQLVIIRDGVKYNAQGLRY